MRIIPVIDLRRGRAVRGAGGDRARYEPVRSRLGGRAWRDLSSPGELLATYRRTLESAEVYVADLDRIEGARANPGAPGVGRDNDAALRGLLDTAPGVRFLLDGGFTGAPDLARAPRDQRLRPVVATETLAALAELEPLAAARPGDPPVLSLDLDEEGVVAGNAAVARAGAPGILRAAAAAGLRSVILLFLRRVGRASGLPAARLEALMRAAPDLAILAGGGIASLADLRRLRDLGARGALLATALHDGRIAPEELAAGGFL